MRKVYAHSLPGCPDSEWQTLEEHSRNVADLAAKFAAPFGSSESARLLGLVHDLGKARSTFQGYLRRQNELDDSSYDSGEHVHSGAGACWLFQELGGLGELLSYCVMGHHAGLPDKINGITPQGALAFRINDEKAVLEELPVREWIAAHDSEWRSRAISRPWSGFNPSDASFWVRMLYSSLVDADFLDTEVFMDGARAEKRGGYSSLGELSDRFFRRLDTKQSSSEQTRSMNFVPRSGQPVKRRQHFLEGCFR